MDGQPGNGRISTGNTALSGPAGPRLAERSASRSRTADRHVTAPRRQHARHRPYVASSFLSVALVNVFKSAMAGTCKGYEELAAASIPLQASLPAVPARGGEALVRRLFEPLGYDVGVTAITLDPQFPDRGDGRHIALQLVGERRLADLLNHHYVLLPVLDDDKHYWVDEAEIEKLMRRRIIYGPEYADPTQIDRLRVRSLGRKRSLAVREFGLGVEALERFVRREPLYRVHECVFGVLAIDSEPVDPRL